jgi:DNA-binding beta-propeller fold protein YncE
VRGGKIAVAAGPGVAVFTPEGKMIVQVGTSRGWGTDQFDLPHGIVQGPEGNIYVADTQNRRIKALSPTGRILWMLGDAPDRSKPGAGDVRSKNSTTTTAPFLLPSGMTMDGKGDLVVVDPFKFRIAIVDAKSGKVVTEKRADGSPGRAAYYGDYGQADGMFAYPTGISYDKTRDWFAVADTSNNRVQIIRLPNTGGSITAPIVGGFRWPMLVCCIPWILLLIAAMMLYNRRRKERESAAAPAGAAAPVPGPAE